MKCPSCKFDNLEGEDFCANCLGSLVGVTVAPRYLKNNVLKDQLKVTELRNPPIVSSATSIQDSLQAMKEKKMGCLLIVDDQELVGIFTERDVVQKLSLPGTDLKGRMIKEVMTPAPEVLSEEQTISAALNKMSMGRYRHVPIRREDGSYSYFSVRDALKYLF